ncbi:MAG: HPr family phosphocarrier protein [Bacillota bacterium]
MYSKTTTVINTSGLHARPASDFVRTAAKYKSDITIRREGVDTAANAKSILFLLSLGLSKGTNVIISADGADEKDAVDALAALIDTGFGE